MGWEVDMDNLLRKGVYNRDEVLYIIAKGHEH